MMDLFASSLAASDQDVMRNAARDLPAGFSETFDVALRSLGEWHNSTAYETARERALASYYDDVKARTGEQLPLYGLSDAVSLDDLNLGIARVAEKFPEQGYLPLTDADVDTMARRRMAKAHGDAAAMAARETTWGGTLGTVLGMAAGIAGDPVTIVTLPLGGVGQMGAALRTLEFAAIAGGTEAATAALNFRAREAAVPGSSAEIPGEIAAATLFGGALGLGFGALGKLLKAGERPLPTAAREEINALASEAQLNASNPFPTAAAEAAHRDGVTEAVRTMARGEPVKAGDNFAAAHFDALAAARGARSPEELAARAEQDLRPETFREAPDVERFDPAPFGTDDTFSYWEGRLAAASIEERRALGAEAFPDLPRVPEGARVTDVSMQGPVVEGLDDRWSDAVSWLRQAQTGDARAVLAHPAIEGRIDVIWGDAGGGLKHIIDNHPDVVPDLPERLAGMGVTSRSENRIVLSDGRARAVIRRDLNGAQKDWLLTAYEIDGRRGKGRTGSFPDDDPARSPDPSADPNIGARVASVEAVPARDLTPEQMVKLAADPQTSEAVLRNLDRIRIERRDADYTVATRLEDGSVRLDSRKLEDVMEELDHLDEIGRELAACATGFEQGAAP